MKNCLSLIKIALAFALMATLCGCLSVRRLTSTPPAPIIFLTAPATNHGFISTATLPTGDYRAVWEDDRGFYYLAPEKIVFKDVFTVRCDGGLYVKKGTNVPAYYFLLNIKGEPEIAKFKVMPQFKLFHSIQTIRTNQIFGEYDAACIETIQKHWYQLIDKTPKNSGRPGKVVVTFYLHPDGSVSGMRIVSSTENDLLSNFCMRAISDIAPFAPWTEIMRQTIKTERREVQFSFYYE